MNRHLSPIECLNATLDRITSKPLSQMQAAERLFVDQHFTPATRFLVTSNHTILPHLAALMEIKDVGSVLNITMPQVSLAQQARWDEFDMNQTTLPPNVLQQVCHHMIADYCCLDYSLPKECADWYDFSGTVWSKGMVLTRTTREGRLWDCARRMVGRQGSANVDSSL